MNTPLITAEQLQAQIGKGVVVIDCRFNLMDKNQGYNNTVQDISPVPGIFIWNTTYLHRLLSMVAVIHYRAQTFSPINYAVPA